MAFRSKAQRAINGCSLDKRCNAVCGTRLASNADKLTESVNLTWTEYQGVSD